MYLNENHLAGPLQIRALEHLWKHGGQTVDQVHEAMNAQAGKPKLAYTTILTVLRNLTRRGLCTQTKGSTRAHTFTATATRAEYRGKVARWLIDEQFSGDAKAAELAIYTVRNSIR